jgi:hypothetical protein
VEQNGDNVAWPKSKREKAEIYEDGGWRRAMAGW